MRFHGFCDSLLFAPLKKEKADYFGFLNIIVPFIAIAYLWPCLISSVASSRLVANLSCQYLRADDVGYKELMFCVGWCVGCNPPFVDCGIRLIGLPAPSGRFFIGVCLPFPLAGRPFHRFHPASSTLSLRIMVNCTGGRFVSAP